MTLAFIISWFLWRRERCVNAEQDEKHGQLVMRADACERIAAQAAAKVAASDVPTTRPNNLKDTLKCIDQALRNYLKWPEFMPTKRAHLVHVLYGDTGTKADNRKPLEGAPAGGRLPIKKRIAGTKKPSVAAMALRMYRSDPLAQLLLARLCVRWGVEARMPKDNEDEDEGTT